MHQFSIKSLIIVKTLPASWAIYVLILDRPDIFVRFVSNNLPGLTKMHMLIHSGEKLHTCGIRMKRFKQAVHHKKQTLIHTGEKPYSCEICKKQFTAAGSLKKT